MTVIRQGPLSAIQPLIVGKSTINKQQPTGIDAIKSVAIDASIQPLGGKYCATVPLFTDNLKK